VNYKVTIVIPVYNGSNFMKVAIDSAIAQTYDNKEILVINDGSTDNGETEKIALSYGNKIRYIKKENGGVATALNLAIKEMKGDYLSWLSHDDIYKPYKIEKQIETIKKLEDKTTILFSNVELIDEKGEIFCTTNYSNLMTHEELCQGIYPVIKGTVNGCSMLISKKCFDKVGLFNENLKTSNDYEMWLRLFKEFKSYLIEEPLIQYRIHKNQDTTKSPYTLKEANKLWVDIINNLTVKEIEGWSFEPFNVYMDLYFQMYYSKYNEAYPVAYKKAKEIYDKSTPKVSIIMPCYNSEKYIEKAIQSVLDQTYRNFELIIIDDDSTDKTWEIIEQYAKKDFRVICTKKDENEKGISKSMNKGIEMARGKYITRMDSDDIIIPEKIFRQVQFLDKNEEYGVCSVNIAMMDNLGNIYNENVYPEQKVPSEWTFLWTNPVPNAPCMYRTNIIKDNNITFSNLRTAEDYDFLEKLITKTKVYMINLPLYYYRYNEKSTYNRNRIETFKNSLDISKKYYTEVTKKNAPDFYKFLTWFYTNEDEPIIEDVQVINEFLEKTAKEFNEYYKWTEEQYSNVKTDILKTIEKYAIYKFLASKYGKIDATFTIKEEKQSSVIRLIKRGEEYLKKNGAKKTIRKIAQKVKGKIWKKK
jgi:uncharacterized glycosyltransferase RF_0543